jgi:hypothetical protein
MSIILYASLPNEVLNLIWTYIDPLLKYSLNKENFNKYYNSRYSNIHYNHYNHYNANPNIINNFNNYNYYYYLLKHDLLIFSTIVLNLYVQKLVSGELVIKKHNAIYYKNLSFYSLIDFFYYYSNITNNSNITNIPNNKKCKDLIIEIISKYNLTHLIKKIHKNNVNKNNRWNI